MESGAPDAQWQTGRVLRWLEGRGLSATLMSAFEDVDGMELLALSADDLKACGVCTVTQL